MSATASERVRVKVYIMWNYDGVNSAMVAAPTLKEAAMRLHTSVYYMRQMGWQYAKEDAPAATDTPKYKPIDARDYTRYPWRERPYHRSRFGGWE